MEAIKLNLIPTGALPVVHASQYDDGRIFRADLYDGAEVYHLDGTETISCELKKPDGNIVTLAVTNTSESFIEIQTTEQACAVAGESLAEVKIEKGADKIGSLNFILSVERSPIEGGISSASEINNLWTQVDGMVADILADSYDSANVIFDNLPTEGHGIPYTVTSEGIGNAIDNALDMTDTASGSIATFDTSLALPLQDCEIGINAVQEAGTPTPSSPKLISGFTGANITNHGKNYWNETIQNGYYSSITGEFVPYASCIANATPIKVKPNTTYYGYSGNYTINGFYYDSEMNFLGIVNITNRTFTTPNNCSYLNFCNNYSAGGTYSNDISINTENDTTYHAYDGHTTAISWQSEAGTVYGAKSKPIVGGLTVDYACATFDGSETGWANYAGGNGYAISISDMKSGTHYSDSKVKCNEFEKQPDNSNLGVRVGVGNKNLYVIQANTIAGVSDLATFKTWLSSHNLVIIYPLETPQTYQLTPTQISAIVGTNNVFTDTNGDTSLEYYTKRGEQTVRIAEGVAVDVINNKSIDTLNTTDKTVKGAINELEAGITDTYTKTEVDTALALKFDNANRVTTGTGTFAGLLNTADRVWLITAQRLSTNNTLMLIAHKQNGNFYFKEIVKDAGMEYNYNSENGSVVVTYGGSTTGVYGGAYRLA